MSCCQDDGTEECLVATTNAFNLVPFEQNGIHLGLEVYLAPTTDDSVTHRLNDIRQFVRTQMGMGVCQDAGTGSMLAKDIENLLHIAALLASCV